MSLGLGQVLFRRGGGGLLLVGRGGVVPLVRPVARGGSTPGQACGREGGVVPLVRPVARGGSTPGQACGREGGVVPLVRPVARGGSTPGQACGREGGVVPLVRPVARGGVTVCNYQTSKSLYNFSLSVNEKRTYLAQLTCLCTLRIT